MYGILKLDNAEARAIIKCLQKKDMTPAATLALNFYRNLLIDHIQPRLTFTCSLNSNYTFLVASLEKKIRVVEECLGDQGASVFRGIAMHEHRRAMCIDVMGDCIKSSEKLSGLCHRFLVRPRTF